MDEEKQPTAPDTPPGPRSKDEILADALVAAAVAGVGSSITDAREFAGEITLTVQAAEIETICRSFKDAGFLYLVDMTAVDYSTYPNYQGDRFAMVYHLYSHEKNNRVRLKAFVPDDVPVPSICSVWKNANWHEREVFDMYGVTFDGHPNLERILMWDGFNGYPLRKDFPIRGIDTGARIYPEVFPEGGGPSAGATGKDVNDVSIYRGEWAEYGKSPVVSIHESHAPAPELANVVADTAEPTPEAPFHDPDMPLAERMDLAKDGDLKTKLFAAMAQTDCTACGWDCEGYADAIARGETSDLTLCVPGEDETEAVLQTLMAGKA